MPTVSLDTNITQYEQNGACQLTVNLDSGNTVNIGSVNLPYVFNPTSYGLDEHDVAGNYVLNCDGCVYSVPVEYTPPPTLTSYKVTPCCDNGYIHPASGEVVEAPTLVALPETDNDGALIQVGNVVSVDGYCVTLSATLPFSEEHTVPSYVKKSTGCQKCITSVNTYNCNETVTDTTTESNECQSTCTSYRVYYQPDGGISSGGQNSFTYTDCDGITQSVNNLQPNNQYDYEDICLCGNPSSYPGHEDYYFATLGDGCYHLDEQ